MTGVDCERLRAILERETKRFVRDHPVSRRMFHRARAAMIGGVPMNCTSFVLMENLGLRKALAFDRNFAEAGFAMIP
jgi:hypothetical protein